MNNDGELTEIMEGSFLLPLRNIEELANEYGKGGKLLIETPLGFKGVGLELARYLSNKGFNVYLSGRNVWGACDFSMVSDYRLIIHLGHALPLNIFRIINNNLRVIGQKHNGDVISVEIGNNSHVVFAPVYYKPQPELLVRLRETAGGIVETNPGMLVAYASPYRLYASEIAGMFDLPIAQGPMTGCFIQFPISSPVLFVGSGYFYPLTFKLLRPRTTVYLLDVFRNMVEDVEHVYRRYLAMKVRMLDEFRNAKLVGIVISRKPGQLRQDLVNPLIKKMRELGKDFVIIELDEVSPDFINNLPVDAVINTACPRVGIDDLDRFIKPVVNAGDILKTNTLDLNNLLVW
ncbi:diphthamide synthesis protein [Vulcanisaeta souniana]|nr:diphthamide synthesis protein [Vulcanisaeta souniana]BDR91167.1 diphthamide biosynthesis enzyme Dph2 [Vulcanisaeta souniana JCM 11219]